MVKSMTGYGRAQGSFSGGDILVEIKSVNNRYLDWICDLADRSFHETHPVKGMRIDYQAEIMPDEEVELSWSLSDERLYCECPGRFHAMLTFR